MEWSVRPSLQTDRCELDGSENEDDRRVHNDRTRHVERLKSGFERSETVLFRTYGYY